MVAATLCAIPSLVIGQPAVTSEPSRELRFRSAQGDSEREPTTIDPRILPFLGRRSGANTEQESCREAMRTTSRASGLQVVCPSDAFRLDDTAQTKATDIASTLVLPAPQVEAGMDVAIGSDGTAEQLRRGLDWPIVRRERIRGRVTADSVRAISQATVLVTRSPDRAIFSASTDATGRYEIVVDSGTGDYLVYVTAPGFRSFRRRVVLATDTMIVVDARLEREVAGNNLAAVRIQVRRQPPTSVINSPISPATVEAGFEGVSSLLTPELRGNLAAMAATFPGVLVGPDGQLVLGGAAGQVSQTISGLAYVGGDLPRDVATDVRFTTSTWDPSIGGFGGGRINVQIASTGWPVHIQTAHLVIDAPSFQLTTSAPGTPEKRFTNVDVGVGGSGPLIPKTLFYNAGAQAKRRWENSSSLLDPASDAWQLTGVSPDSVGRLLQLLALNRIPVTAATIPGQRVDESASFLGSLLHVSKEDQVRGREPAVALVTGSASVRQTGGIGGGPTMAPSVGATSRAYTWQIVAELIQPIGEFSLSETQSGLALRGANRQPYSSLPRSNVSVSSIFPDGTSSTGSLSFGGASSELNSEYGSWQTTNVSQFYVGNAHRLKTYAESRVEWFRQSANPNANGTFSFRSLGDVAANLPSSFTRTLSPTSSTGGELSGVLGAGDVWRVKPTLQIEASLRLEGSRFTNTPSRDPLVAQRLGVPIEGFPGPVEMVPRVGFAWSYGSLRNAPLGSAALGRLTAPARGVLSGGIGEFRDALPADLLASAMTNTGLIGGDRRITCLGPEAPKPDWSSYELGPEAIPTTCRSGAPSVLATSAPDVVFFNPGYRPPRTWRAGLRWSSASRWLRYSLDATYALNLEQPDALDRNFSGSAKFFLSDEGGRPVFVSPTNIVQSSGLASTLDSRVSTAYGNVWEHLSSAHSISRSLTMRIVPDWPSRRGLFSIAYTLGDVRESGTGFSQATFSSPLVVEQSRGRFDVRHQIVAQVAYPLASWLTANASLFVRSGVPYSPLVGGDVNGDGAINDRAYVFDPARIGDPGFARALQTLLGTTSSQAQRCLKAQLGSPAGRNSCEGPWTANVNAVLTTKEFRALGGRNLHGTLHFANLLGGIDGLLHGEGRLHGWGIAATPDPILYFVRGFDEQGKRFLYEVNPRFGSTRPSQTLARAPVRITLEFSLELSESSDRQSLRHMLDAGRAGRRGPRMSADSLRLIYARTLVDIYSNLFSERDSLLLSGPQVSALEASARPFRASLDTLWRNLAERLVSLGDEYDAAAAMTIVDDTYDRASELAKAELPHIREILLPVQVALAYGAVGDLLSGRAQKPVRRQLFR
jgi:hypothetical protein